VKGEHAALWVNIVINESNEPIEVMVIEIKSLDTASSS